MAVVVLVELEPVCGAERGVGGKRNCVAPETDSTGLGGGARRGRVEDDEMSPLHGSRRGRDHGRRRARRAKTPKSVRGAEWGGRRKSILCRTRKLIVRALGGGARRGRVDDEEMNTMWGGASCPVEESEPTRKLIVHVWASRGVPAEAASKMKK
jgi:hypothetical protein